MSKALTRLALALLAASLCARAAAAQTTLEWIVLAPAGEGFTALMPKEPLRLEQEVRAGELVAAGRRYTAAAGGGARYVVWALKDTQDVGARLRPLSYEGWRFSGESRYLDLVAEAAWELLVRPEVERLEAEARRTGVPNKFSPSMSAGLDFDIGGRPARGYTVRLEKEGGPVYVCAGGGRVYVVAALSPDPNSPESKRFVNSFGLKSPATEAAATSPLSGIGTAAGTGASTSTTFGLPRHPSGGVAPIYPSPLPPVPAVGGAPADDYNRPLKLSEVTRKAVITYKPEPGFTEGARKFEVTGVVRLRAVLSTTGEMTHISVVKYLPHGLTEKAMDAARRIRFTPAQKDGRAVSQYVVLEYNYNIY